VEGLEISGNLFTVSPFCRMVLIQIVPGMHLVTFIGIAEKGNVCV